MPAAARARGGRGRARRLEVPGEAERAGAAQRDLAALRGRGGELDGLGQQDGGVGLDVGGEREPELAAHVGLDGRVERRLGERAAQEDGGALGRAAGRRARGGGAQRGDGRRRRPQARCAAGAARRARGRRARRASSRAARACQSARSPGAQARVEGAGDQRVRERELAGRPRAAPRRAARRRARGGRRLQARRARRRGAAARRGRGPRTRARARRRRRGGARAGARRCARPARARTRSDRAATSSVGATPLGDQVAEQRAEQERVAGGDRVAGVREPACRPAGSRSRDERLGGGRAERTRAQRRLGRRRRAARRAAPARRPARRRGRRTSTPSGSSSSRRASWASQRSDGASAQWTSSTTSSVGPRSARLPASHISPCAAACIASPAERRLGRVRIERASRERRGADRQLVPVRAGAQRFEQLPGDAPGGILLERAAARAQHDRRRRASATPRGGREQARLADPGRALDHDHDARTGAHRARAAGRAPPAPASRSSSASRIDRPYARQRRRHRVAKDRGGVHDARGPAAASIAAMTTTGRSGDEHRDRHHRRLRAGPHPRGVRAAARAGARVGGRDRPAARPGRARARRALPGRRLRTRARRCACWPNASGPAGT